MIRSAQQIAILLTENNPSLQTRFNPPGCFDESADSLLINSNGPHTDGETPVLDFSLFLC